MRECLMFVFVVTLNFTVLMACAVNTPLCSMLVSP